MPTIQQNLTSVKAQIADACALCGRPPESVKLLAVSKTFPPGDVADAFACGQLAFGENRVQELELKAPVLSPQIAWHLIGHLQSNKASKAACFADWIHSVDSEKLIGKLDQSAGELRRKINILLEVNISGEESKNGIRSWNELCRIVESALSSQNLQLQGLMTMAEFGAEQARIRSTFAGLRQWRDRLTSEFNCSLPELSMGMSGDFREAIAEGATIVRIGTAIFGNRG